MYNHSNGVSKFPYIPKEAFLFAPKWLNNPRTQDDFKTFEGKKLTRYLFQGWASNTYTPFQLQRLNEFEEYLKKHNINLDQRWNKSWKLRFLLSTNCDIEKCIKDMGQFLLYINRVRDVQFTPTVAKYLRCGAVYIAGRDSHYRPILVFDAEKLITLKITEDQSIELLEYFLEYVMKHFLIPGQVENWIALVDSNYQGFFSLVGALKKSFTFLANTYRSRLYCAYNVRINYPIKLVWEVCQKFLDEETVRKINLVEDVVPQGLFQFCNRSQVEVKFGGTLPNIRQGQYWPPKMEHSPNYSCNNSPVTLMTRQTYTDLYKTKQLFDTKIMQSLLIEQEPTEYRENTQKKSIKQMERHLLKRLVQSQEETVNLDRLTEKMKENHYRIDYQELVMRLKEKKVQ